MSLAAFLKRLERAGYVLALAAIALCAIQPARNLLHPAPADQSIRLLPEGLPVTVEGILIDPPEHLPGRVHLMLQVRRAGASDRDLAPATGIVRVTVLDRINPRVGDEIAVTSRLRFPRNNGNPGEYDYAGFLQRNGIAATMTIAPKQEDSGAFRVLAHHPRFPFNQLQNLRDRIANLIDSNLPPDQAGEMRALVVGDRSGIDDNLRDAFARSGMAHLLVISGLHLGFVAAAMFAAIRFLVIALMPGLASRGWANKAGALGAALAVCAYTAIAGHHVSTVRAMVMVLVYMMAIVLDRASEAIASLAVAAIVICFVLPGSTADVGFQLSFASVFAIVVGMRRFLAWTKMRQRRGRLPAEPPARGWVLAQRPVGYIAVSFFGMLGTAPLTAFHFNQIAFVGLIANAVVVPIMGFGATIAGLLAAMCGLVWAPLGSAIFGFASYALRASNWLAAWFVAWPGAWAHIFTPTVVELALAYGLIVLWLTAPFASLKSPAPSKLPRAQEQPYVPRWRPAAAFLIVMLLAVDAAWWCHDRFFSPDLRVTFLAVGEGDAAVVRFPGRRVMLIDAGSAYGGFDSGERIIAPYLWSQKILRVDYLVLSHPDADHFGGFAFIASNFSPGEFWASRIPSRDRGYAAMLVAMMQAHVRPRIIDGNGPPITISGVDLHTFEENPPARAQNNNGSLVLRLCFGTIGYLFTGDIEAAAEQALVDQGVDLRSTILKVPHHGSKTSSTAEFIEAVHPAAAVISDGYQNHFHFPAPQVVDRYRQANVKLFRTDLDGAIMTGASRDVIRMRAYKHPGNTLVVH